jgi:hypothetical protein
MKVMSAANMSGYATAIVRLREDEITTEDTEDTEEETLRMTKKRYGRGGGIGSVSPMTLRIASTDARLTTIHDVRLDSMLT